MSAKPRFRATSTYAARQIPLAQKVVSVKDFRGIFRRAINGVLIRKTKGVLRDVVDVIEPPHNLVVQGLITDQFDVNVDYSRQQIKSNNAFLDFPFTANLAYGALNTNIKNILLFDDISFFFNRKYSVVDSSLFNRVIPSIEWVKDNLETKRKDANEDPFEYTTSLSENIIFIGGNPLRGDTTEYRIKEGNENEDPSEDYFLSWFFGFESNEPFENKTLKYQDNNGDPITGQNGLDYFHRIYPFDDPRVKDRIEPFGFQTDRSFKSEPSIPQAVSKGEGQIFYDFKFHKASSPVTYRIYEQFVNELGFDLISRGYSQLQSDYEDNFSDLNLRSTGVTRPPTNSPSAVLRGVFLEVVLPVFSQEPLNIGGGFNYGELSLLYLRFQVEPNVEVRSLAPDGFIFEDQKVISFVGTNAEQTLFSGTNNRQPSGAEVVIKPAGEILAGYVKTVVLDDQGPVDEQEGGADPDNLARVKHYVIGYLEILFRIDNPTSVRTSYEDISSWTVPFGSFKPDSLSKFTNRDFKNETTPQAKPQDGIFGKPAETLRLEMNSQLHVFVKNKLIQENAVLPYKAIILFKAYRIFSIDAENTNNNEYVHLGLDYGKPAADSGMAVMIDGADNLVISDSFPAPEDIKNGDSRAKGLHGITIGQDMHMGQVQNNQFFLSKSNPITVLFYQKDRSEYLTKTKITLSDAEDLTSGDIFPFFALDGIAYKEDILKEFVFGPEFKLFGDTSLTDDVKKLDTGNPYAETTVSCVQQEYFDDSREFTIPPIFIASYYTPALLKFEDFEPSVIPETPEEYRNQIVNPVTLDNGISFSFTIGFNGFVRGPKTDGPSEPFCYLMRTKKFPLENGDLPEPLMEKVLIGKFYGLAVSYRGNGLPRLPERP